MKRVGIVGCGGISRVHVWALQQIGDCEITALCDLVPERAHTLAGEYGLENVKCYEHFDELLGCGGVDVVHLCTPHNTHAPMACSALQNHISVFLEKPAAISKEQLRRLQEVQETADASLGICFQNRYNLATQKLDALVASGVYGKVQGGRAVVTWRRDEAYYAGSRWKGSWETEGGGVLINQSIHTLDLLLRYLGEPLRIEASMANHHLRDTIAVEDTVEAWLEFPEGKRGCFYASSGYVTDAPIWLELQCERGSLLLTDGAILQSCGRELQVISCPEPRGIGKAYWGSGHLACIRDFYECLQSHKRFQNDLQGVFVTADTVLKIYEKGRETRWNK